MSPILQNLITLLVPILLQFAEQQLGATPNPNDKTWVAGLIQEIVSLIMKYIPGWMAPSVQQIEQVVAAEIEKLLGITPPPAA